MKNYSFLLLTLGFFYVSCNNPQQNGATDQKKSSDSTQQQAPLAANQEQPLDIQIEPGLQMAKVVRKRNGTSDTTNFNGSTKITIQVLQGDDLEISAKNKDTQKVGLDTINSYLKKLKIGFQSDQANMLEGYLFNGSEASPIGEKTIENTSLRNTIPGRSSKTNDSGFYRIQQTDSNSNGSNKVRYNIKQGSIYVLDVSNPNGGKIDVFFDDTKENGG